MSKFTFVMDLPQAKTSRLLQGKLTYTDDEGKNTTFEATSGQPGFQYTTAWLKKGLGCIPPSTIAGKYKVSTQALYMPNVSGINGNFYPISPFEVRMGTVVRGDFGIHLDSNFPQSPGSAGCIALRNRDHWGKIQDIFRRLHEARIKAVDVEVIYI